MIGKQNYVSPITPYCMHVHLRLILILLLNFWSKETWVSPHPHTTPHDKHMQIQNGEEDGAVPLFQSLLTWSGCK